MSKLIKEIVSSSRSKKLNNKNMIRNYEEMKNRHYFMSHLIVALKDLFEISCI